MIISQDIYPQHNDVAEQPEKPLSRKQTSLMFYEPPAQFRHMLMQPSKPLAYNNCHFESSLSSTDCDQTLSDSSSASSMRSYDDEQSLMTNQVTTANEYNSEEPSDHTRIMNKKSIRRLDDIIKSVRTNTLKSNSSKNIRLLDNIFKSITKNTVKIKKSSMIIHQLDTEFKTGRNNFPETSYYSSNHLMVNRERAIAGLNPLYRSRFLDSLAQSHAADLAESCEVQVLSNLESLLVLGGSNNNQGVLVGQNVQRGTSIRQMHSSVMNSSGVDSRRSNILRPTFTEFGMATAPGKDGKLYMVQLFRGGSVNNQEDDAEQQPKELQQDEIGETPKEEEEEFFC